MNPNYEGKDRHEVQMERGISLLVGLGSIATEAIALVQNDPAEQIGLTAVAASTAVAAYRIWTNTRQQG